ncbi:MAG TPA: NAD(P)-dependent oxidoreductase [Candidatus Acidoferrum sp.]|jgi:3-hydroxyisobutyrate dehydrogenase-like beta-hydroxyacid dehydrogenase|nr:NAD(P)-dependent oxidoreductase [Candidatus Acidoferrum sp.]
MQENIGFIGLGNMGEPIAANLIAAGHSLKVYNRTASKAEPLKAKGATIVATAAEVATPGGIVFTMLADDRALDQVCTAEASFVETLGHGGVHVSLSTIAPATAKHLAEHHRKHGVDYVGSPVFGRPEAAAAKRLWICDSGPAAARERVRPLLAAIGQRTYEFGDDPAAAHVVKLCGNFMIAAALEALAETFALAEKNGVDPAAVSQMMGETLFACPIYQIYSKLIVDGQFEDAKFRLALGLKDMSLVAQTAAASNMPMPLVSLVRDRLLASTAKGRADWDWTALALDVAENSGLRKAAAR